MLRVNRTREETKEAMDKRSTQMQGRQDSMGSILKPELGIVPWRCKEGDHEIDIIDYDTGNFDPVDSPGELSHCLEVYVHGNVGPGEESFVCLAKTYKQPCAICDNRKQLEAQNADEDLIKSLDIKQPKCLYNIVCYDSPEEEAKGVQLWIISRWLSQRYFDQLAKGSRRGNPGEQKIRFADRFEGKTICFTRQGTGYKNTQMLGHRFIDRNYDIDETTLNASYCLDEIIHIPTYEEVAEAHFTGMESDEIPEPTTTTSPRSGRSRRSPEPEEVETTPETNNPCPMGFAFGVDLDAHPDECEVCDEWKLCARENRKQVDNPITTKELEPQTSENEISPSPVRRRRRG